MIWGALIGLGFWILGSVLLIDNFLNVILLWFNMEKQMMDFTVLIEQDEDGVYVANVPEIDGCYSQGRTLEEVFERIREAIEVCLEGDREEVNPMKFIGVQKISVEKSISV